MNIDERLEALVQSCELLQAHTLEQGTQIDAHTKQIDAHTKQIAAHTKQIEAHTKQLEQDGEHIRALVRIAEIHEHRLERLEDSAP